MYSCLFVASTLYINHLGHWWFLASETKKTFLMLLVGIWTLVKFHRLVMIPWVMLSVNVGENCCSIDESLRSTLADSFQGRQLRAIVSPWNNCGCSLLPNYYFRYQSWKFKSETSLQLLLWGTGQSQMQPRIKPLFSQPEQWKFKAFLPPPVLFVLLVEATMLGQGSSVGSISKISSCGHSMETKTLLTQSQ